MSERNMFEVDGRIPSPTRSLFLRARLASAAALIIAVAAVGLLR